MKNKLLTKFIIFFFIPFILSIIFLFSFSRYLFIPKMRESYILQKKDSIRNFVDFAFYYIDENYKDVKAKKINEEQALENINRFIEEFRYGKDKKNYFWITNLKSEMISHPYTKDILNTNLYDYQDAAGKYMFREFFDIANETGEGFTTYTWQRFDNKEEFGKKLSYIRIYRPKGFIVGTGEYLDDIDNEIDDMIKREIKFGISIMTFFIIISGFYGVNLVRLENLSIDKEKLLKESEKKYKAIFDNAFQLTCILNKEGQFIESNSSTLQIMGKTNEDVKGMYIWNSPWWQNSQLMRENIKEMVNKAKYGETVKNDTTHIDVNGKVHFVDFSIKPVFDDNGEILFLIVEGNDYTELQELNDALRNSEKKFRTIYENSNEGFMLLTEKDGFVDCNKRALEIFDAKSFDKLINKKLCDLSPEFQPDNTNSKEKCLEHISNAYINGKDSFEWVCKKIKGEEFYAKILFSRIIISEKVYIFAVLEDITQTKEKEKEIFEQEKMFRDIFEKSPVSMMLFDQNGNLLKINRQGIWLWGEDIIQSIGKVNICDWEKYNEFNVIEKSSFGEDIFIDTERFEIAITKNSKVEKFLKTYFFPITGPSDVLKYIVCCSIDMTDEVENQKKLKESSDLLKKSFEEQSFIFNNINDFVYKMDNNGNFLYISESVEKITGYTSKEFKKIKDSLFTENTINEKYRHFRVIDNNNIYNHPHKVEIFNKNGEKILLELSEKPYYKDGNISGLIGIGRDITTKVKMDEFLLQNEKMMSIGGLAAGMAHEINNPLSGIIQGVDNCIRRLSRDLPANVKVGEDIDLNLEKMEQYLKERKIDIFLDGIKSSAKRAAQIVRNMLEFSRASNREKTIENIIDIIDNTLELAANDYDLKKRFDFRHIDIKKQYSNDNIKILCISSEIEQVFLNILKNAAHALFQNKVQSPRIIIKVLERKSKVIVSIKNNGPGIPYKIRKRIFEPFFTTKEVGEGTGLGLSVSYFIINNNHKGKIWVESEENSGTEFFIEFNLYKG